MLTVYPMRYQRYKTISFFNGIAETMEGLAVWVFAIVMRTVLQFELFAVFAHENTFIFLEIEPYLCTKLTTSWKVMLEF